jgi:hypothetical protein
MTKIDSTSFGIIIVDGREYKHDIIIDYKGKIKEAKTKIRHLFSKDEFEELAKENPEIIIVGNGQYSAMKIDEEVKKIAKERKIELIILPTPKAIEKFNELVESKKVCAYLHVTC